jgi:hypothetical protein
MRAPALCQVYQLRVLDRGSTILGSCDITRRNRGGPRQGERGLGLEAANIGVRGMKFPWVGWLLSKVYFELLQDCNTNYRASEERKQVSLE